MKKIYISGKISESNPEIYKANFDKSEKLIKEMNGYAVNPVSIVKSNFDDDFFSSSTDEEIWQKCMRVCLSELVKCDSILMQENWKESEGAKIELFLAIKLGLNIFFEKENLDCSKSMVVGFIPEFTLSFRDFSKFF